LGAVKNEVCAPKIFQGGAKKDFLTMVKGNI
jgi:hypothetical protein